MSGRDLSVGSAAGNLSRPAVSGRSDDGTVREVHDAVDAQIELTGRDPDDWGQVAQAAIECAIAVERERTVLLDRAVAAEAAAERLARDIDAGFQAVRDQRDAARAEVARLTTENERLRTHTLDSNPALRTLHTNAVAYLDAVEALSEVRGGPLSTTIAYLIRRGYLIPSGSPIAEGEK